MAKTPGGGTSAALSGDEVAAGFSSPPFDCGPWVYWFWLDVNVTREGITTDLEAMKAVGIAGVLIMDVNEGTPASFNGAKFGDSKWYELFQFACEEANRLGIQVNMTNDAGWCGSGGPWITPELSMQVVVWSSASVAGGQLVNIKLPQPETKMDYYRDIAVLAFPTPAVDKVYRIPDLRGLTDMGAQKNIPARLHWKNIPADQRVSKSSILDLTGNMDEHGVLRCELPAGDWTVLRFGHTTTGVNNHPAPVGGLGLETDKLSRKATLFQFESLMGRIVKNVGPLAGKTLVATHIDSWETGSQNWTPTMRDDFKRLRGYDLLPYLPVLTGQVVDSLEMSQRFLWDFRKTIGDLLVENYAVAMRETAQKHGLRLSIEGYSGEPASNLRYGGQADEPMSECWSWGRFGSSGTVTEMTSAGHVYGRNIIGQETFTANSDEKWLGHPAVVKDIGDWTFCEGINRFVFHRYAMQPWTNPHYAPGMSMGPWGLHYERTQTWWNMSKPWHDYVARCQYMLRQGHFVADVCYMQAEGEPQRFSPPDNGPGHPPRRPGYNYDGCPPEIVLERMEFKDGFLTLPGGMKYRVLVLPDSPTMTPELLGKIKRLVDAGALVIGKKPEKSPSLMDYPHCDDEVQRLSAELWDNDKIISGKTAAETLTAHGIKPDFECDQPMVRWIHRRTDNMDIYFVANGAVAGKYPFAGRPMVANCSFRMANARPEIWDPETGRISPVALYDT
ncbi:MAG: glycosyl hydrolase, partial [Limisphaerales bacterium]